MTHTESIISSPTSINSQFTWKIRFVGCVDHNNKARDGWLRESKWWSCMKSYKWRGPICRDGSSISYSKACPLLTVNRAWTPKERPNKTACMDLSTFDDSLYNRLTINNCASSIREENAEQRCCSESLCFTLGKSEGNLRRQFLLCHCEIGSFCLLAVVVCQCQFLDFTNILWLWKRLLLRKAGWRILRVSFATSCGS